MEGADEYTEGIWKRWVKMEGSCENSLASLRFQWLCRDGTLHANQEEAEEAVEERVARNTS